MTPALPGRNDRPAGGAAHRTGQRLIGSRAARGAKWQDSRAANATYDKPVTVTSYFVGLTPFGFWLTTYSVQRTVDVTLRNAFASFNGLVITGLDGVALPSPLVFNPGEGLASEDCSQNGKNREPIFQTQSFASANLLVTRKAFVPNNSDFVRWLHIVTNTGTTPRQVGITLQGLLGSGPQTKIGTTPTGDSTRRPASCSTRAATPTTAAATSSSSTST